MDRLPDDVAAVLAAAVGTYIRATPDVELPASLRRFKRFRPQGLARHRETLVGVLDDDAQRARILQWLKNGHTPLTKDEERILRLACERADGWLDKATAGSSKAGSSKKSAVASRSAIDPGADLEKERAKARKARDDLKVVRERERTARSEHEKGEAQLKKEIAALKAEANTARSAATRADNEAKKARDELERERRKIRRDLESARATRDAARKETRAARAELQRVKSQVGELKVEVAALKRASRARPPKPPSPTRRKPLVVPKGRYEDAPETLEAWLEVPSVHLLVDGYNVTKAEGGYGDLELAQQRERLVQEVTKLIRRKGARATVIFDGSNVPPGTSRRSRGPVYVEYSRASEIGDDHLIAKLEELPPDPVVVATNDRELQGRAAALGATVATSNQLLGLIR